MLTRDLSHGNSIESNIFISSIRKDSIGALKALLANYTLYSGPGATRWLKTHENIKCLSERLLRRPSCPYASFGRSLWPPTFSSPLRWLSKTLLSFLIVCALVPPVRQYLRFTVRESPTGQSDPPIGQLEARIRVGHPIHLLLLAN